MKRIVPSSIFGGGGALKLLIGLLLGCQKNKICYNGDMIHHYYGSNKTGFTLAEVLITLGIIGIVSALTMPVLIGNYQKRQTVTQLKKAYSELSQAAAMATLTYGDMENWDFSSGTGLDFFNKYFTSFMNISQTTVADVKNAGITYIGTSGNSEASLTNMRDEGNIITLPSGAQIFASNSSNVVSVNPDQDRRAYVVDLNGYKRPNKFGRDLFMFAVTKKHGVTPFSYDDTENSEVERDRDELLNGPSAENYQCSRSGRGMWCAAVIMMDGWEIRDDYPW